MFDAVRALSSSDRANVPKVYQTIGKAIIDHLIANGANAVNTVTPGVQSGPSAATGKGTLV